MIAFRKATEIRPATDADMREIARLRAMHQREFVGEVPVPVNVTWFVAEDEGMIRACAGLAIVTAQGHERTVIITDFYDDGTFAGKRALLAMLDDGIAADVALYVIVPCDRMPLVSALEKRGLRCTGVQMEKPRR